MKTKNYTHPSRRSFRLAALLAAVMLMAMAAQTARAGTYKINVRDYLMDVGYVSIGGTGSADKTTADAGETVTLMATANSGYRFFTWVVGGFSNDVHIEASNMAITTFTMPAHDVTIYARFAVKNNEVTTSASPSTGGAVKVSLDNAKWVESLHAKVGETVYFTLNSNDGYKPYTCSVTSGGNQLETVGNSFTMPNGDVTVTGNFLENNTGSAQSYNLSVYANQSTSLSETYNGSGTASGPNQATQGALVTLTATPNNGSTFNHWQIYNPIIGNYFFSSDATMTFLMPAGNVSATAYFRSGTTATLNETNGFTSAVFDATKGQYANFSRDFTSSVASTVCLPFNYHTSQASGKFYVFAGVDKTTNPWTVTMVNSSYSSNKVTGMLTAGTPYMYVPSASATPTFGGTVKVSSASHTDASEMDGGTWQFIGNFESKTSCHFFSQLFTLMPISSVPGMAISPRGPTG